MPNTIKIDGKTYWTMGDAAYAQNLDGTSFGIVAGYFGGPQAFHIWPATDWDRFPGYKLPIWVSGFAGEKEAQQALVALERLDVPKNKYIAIDLETRVDRTYVEHFAAVMEGHYRVMTYGSADYVFRNPGPNGYWVADYTNEPHMVEHEGVRATQYETNRRYDSSIVKKWMVDQHCFWH